MFSKSTVMISLNLDRVKKIKSILLFDQMLIKLVVALIKRMSCIHHWLILSRETTVRSTLLPSLSHLQGQKSTHVIFPASVKKKTCWPGSIARRGYEKVIYNIYGKWKVKFLKVSHHGQAKSQH